MADSFGKLAMAAALGTLLLAGAMSGCSSLSADHVDCNVVKLQTESGRTDAEIASAIGAKIKDVEACHGPEKSGNRSSNTAIPSDY